MYMYDRYINTLNCEQVKMSRGGGRDPDPYQDRESGIRTRALTEEHRGAVFCKIQVDRKSIQIFIGYQYQYQSNE